MDLEIKGQVYDCFLLLLRQMRFQFLNHHLIAGYPRHSSPVSTHSPSIAKALQITAALTQITQICVSFRIESRVRD